MRASALKYSVFCLLLSCSVLEDRVPCPCFVRVCPDEGKTFRGECFFFSFPEEGGMPDPEESRMPDVKAAMEYGPGSEQERIVMVPKGGKRLVMLEGLCGMTAEGPRLLVDRGMECDSLRCWSEKVDCGNEEAVFRVGRTKHYATVHFSFENDGGAKCPFRVRVKGTVCGLDMCSLEPVEGEYLFAPAPLTEDAYSYRFRVPRQKDDSLELEILDGDTAVVRDVLPLGGIMKRSGYDWSKAVLDDVRIVMDHVVAGIAVDVVEWEENLAEPIFIANFVPPIVDRERSINYSINQKFQDSGHTKLQNYFCETRRSKERVVCHRRN